MVCPSFAVLFLELSDGADGDSSSFPLCPLGRFHGLSTLGIHSSPWATLSPGGSQRVQFAPSRLSNVAAPVLPCTAPFTMLVARKEVGLVSRLSMFLFQRAGAKTRDT